MIDPGHNNFWLYYPYKITVPLSVPQSSCPYKHLTQSHDQNPFLGHWIFLAKMDCPFYPIKLPFLFNMHCILVKDCSRLDNIDWSCCTSNNQCAVGQGDCDTDSDCLQGLKCGFDNCKQFNGLAHRQADCCSQGISLVYRLFLYLLS